MRTGASRWWIGLGLSLLCWVQAGCGEGPCSEGETRCSPLKNRVEMCDANGTFVATDTCPGNTCVTSGAGAACEMAQGQCTPGEKRCGASGDIEWCNSAGTLFEVRETCATKMCSEASGAPVCGQMMQGCTPGDKRCGASGDIEWCNSAGNKFEVRETCPSKMCSEDSGAPKCVSGQMMECTPGAKRCGASGDIEWCNSIGTKFEVRETCPSKMCSEDSGAPVCAGQMNACTPGDKRCAADGNIEWCNSAGSKFEVRQTCTQRMCSEDSGAPLCVGGSETICTPGEKRCGASGDIEWCNSIGTKFEVRQTCQQKNCSEDSGAPLCGSAAMNACTPGAKRCSASGDIEWCNSAGKQFEVRQTCPNNNCEETSGAPACGAAPMACTPGTDRCSAGGDIERCNSAGDRFDVRVLCPNNSCTEVNGPAKCGATAMMTCTPGAKRCGLSGDIEWCNSTGTLFEVRQTCQQKDCSEASGAPLCGAVTGICTPGAQRCAVGGDIEKCNSAGDRFDVSMTCPSNTCSEASGSPVCGMTMTACTPGAERCSMSGAIERCNVTGTRFEVRTTCPLSSPCAVVNGAPKCQAPPMACVPNTRRCSASGGGVELCRLDGSGYDVSDLCEFGQCAVTNGNPSCPSCIAGALKCGANNARLDICNPQGTGYVLEQTCSGSTCKFIDGVPACELPCTPGAKRCSALKNRVEECNAAGTAFVALATCTGNSCVAANGGAICQPDPPECAQGETRCSPLGTIIEVCGADGRFGSGGGSCAAANCQVTNGVAACGAPQCEAGAPFCGMDNKIYYCNSSGQINGVKQDCGATATCAELAGVAQCVPPAVAMSCTPNKQFCGDDDIIYYCDATGQVSGVREACGAGKVCGIDGGAPVCINGRYEMQGGMTVCVVTDPNTCVAVQKAGSTRGYVYAEATKPSCDQPSTVVRECADKEECVDGMCTSSVLDMASPYYQYSCPLVQQLEHKTSLEADCRCAPNNTANSPVKVCGRPYDRGTQGVRIGGGPSLVGLANAHYSGGFIDGNELIVAAYWGASTQQRGMLLGINVETGDRRLISGDHNGTVRGSGPGFTYALDARKGANGDYYVMTQSVTPSAPSIFRVNPTTGDRTLAWRGQDASFGQCAAGDPAAAAQGIYVQYTNTGFTMDAAGNFYLGYANVQRDGRGLVKISANGQTCSFIAATGARADGLTRGTGPDLGGFVQGFSIRNNKLIAHTTQPKSLVEIDLTTGNRTVLFTTSIAGDIGERWSLWDATRNVYWTAGLPSSVTIVAYDPAQNKRLDVFQDCGSPSFPWFPLCPGIGPIKINSLNYGGMWMHPTNGNLLFAHDSVSIVEFEPSTGNSVIRSL
jgi:hypothetical protein